MALSLALLSFLALLILALVALIGVESRVAQATKNQQLAKAHAKVAMWIALGELKEHLGPDERITARGDFLDEDPDNPSIEGGQRYWTGVWKSDDPSASPVWLVSGDSPDPQDGYTAEHGNAPLVGGTGDSSVDDRVLAPFVPVTSGVSPGKQSGRYAYWIGDEGLKSKLQPGETNSENFHDATLYSWGVLADAKRGGLRRDLTAGLEYDVMDSEGKAILTQEPIFKPIGEVEDNGNMAMGQGFVPGMGFPEVKGYMMYNNARQSGGSWSPTRGMPRSLFPFNSRCEIKDVYAPYSYSLHIEDLDRGTPDRGNGTFGDLKLDLMRMSDGSIMINLNYNKGCGYHHTIVDPSGTPVPGLFDCSVGRWRNGEIYSATLRGGSPALDVDPGGPRRAPDQRRLRRHTGRWRNPHGLDHRRVDCPS